MTQQTRPVNLARAARRHEIRRIADSQHGVLSRRQLYAAGVTRWELQAELRAERWRLHGRQTVATHTGDLDIMAFLWFAVAEAGPRAALDGLSALIAAGLVGLTQHPARVSIPRGARPVRARGIDVRQTRRLQPTDLCGAGIPRVRPDIAAIRAGIWAMSDRQAATILAMVVQQRIATAQALGRALLEVRRDRRRRFLEAVVLDLLDGAHSLGELDFAVLCRRRGLPAPDRQVVRQGPKGRVYLDVRWGAYGVLVEVDGAQHREIHAVVPDALRQNDVSLAGDLVLRIPLLALRVSPEAFMDQVEQALATRGWTRLAAVRHTS